MINEYRNEKTIKSGNLFNLISIFRNAVTRELIEITADMQFAAMTAL